MFLTYLRKSYILGRWLGLAQGIYKKFKRIGVGPPWEGPPGE